MLYHEVSLLEIAHDIFYALVHTTIQVRIWQYCTHAIIGWFYRLCMRSSEQYLQLFGGCVEYIANSSNYGFNPLGGL